MVTAGLGRNRKAAGQGLSFMMMERERSAALFKATAEMKAALQESRTFEEGTCAYVTCTSLRHGK